MSSLNFCPWPEIIPCPRGASAGRFQPLEASQAVPASRGRLQGLLHGCLTDSVLSCLVFKRSHPARQLPLTWAAGIKRTNSVTGQSESTESQNARRRLSPNLLSDLEFLAGSSPKLLPDFHTTPRPAGIHSTEVREPGFTPRDHRGQEKGQWDPRRAGGDREPRAPQARTQGHVARPVRPWSGVGRALGGGPPKASGAWPRRGGPRGALAPPHPRPRPRGREAVRPAVADKVV